MFPGGWVSAVLQLGGQQLVGDTRGRVWVYAGGRGSLVSTHQVFTSAPVASIQVRPPRPLQPVSVILCIAGHQGSCDGCLLQQDGHLVQGQSCNCVLWWQDR